MHAQAAQRARQTEMLPLHPHAEVKTEDVLSHLYFMAILISGQNDDFHTFMTVHFKFMAKR